MIFRFLFFIAFSTLLWSQPFFNEMERLQGYRAEKNQSYFIFDETIYSVQPGNIIVEGSFRGWNHDLQDQTWWLKKSEKQPRVWFLETAAAIANGSSFKFRIDDGVWQNVPANAPNARGGNLIFGHNVNPPDLKAEMVSKRHIRAKISGEGTTVSLDPGDYRLYRADGIEVPVAGVFYVRPGEAHIYPAEDVDVRRVYYLQDKRFGLKSPVKFDGYFRHLYSDKKLGAFFDATLGQTIFRLFSPRATAVKLYLYKEPGANSHAEYDLKKDENGIWEISIKGNLNGIYYDYTVHGFSDPGNHFFETTPVHITDPYGQVSVDSFGPCRVWPDVEPPRTVRGGIPKMEDVIAYEVHVQDFTRKLPVSENKKGTFTAFFEKGLRNSRGEKIGFDHIVDLGVNVVHLQPIQEFLHFPEKDWETAFMNDPFMMENGINEENYQWGYRTTHFFAIESRYREKGSEWGAQNNQFRDLIEAFHDAGIAVIVDIVFNHTGERMDGRMDYFNFSVLDKLYHYRTNNELNYIGEYGTETKSEERPMMQRWIYDQCLNLVNQYGVDGFRIDLAGQTDKQTLRELKRRLGPNIIVYGEPWIASADPAYESNPDWDWYKKDAPITFFQDDTRNAICGPPDNPKNKWKDRGFAGGNGERENVKKALSAGFPDDHTPISGINYADIHDNWALADRFARENWDGRFGVDENRVKIAATLLLTSLGPVVLHGGTEFLRSKGSAELKETVKKFQGKNLYFHGKRDTYNLVKANEFVWENKGKHISDAAGMIYCEYDGMYKFWRGLIALRKSEYGKVFRIADIPAKNYYTWIEPENTKLLGYIVDGKILVLINSDIKEGKFAKVSFPKNSRWQLMADINTVDLNGLSGHPDTVLDGSKIHNFILPQESLKIWVRTE